MSKAKALIGALIAMVAIGAQAAGAQAADFTAESYPVEIFGEQPEGEPHTWSVGGSEMACEEYSVEAILTQPRDGITVLPEADDCVLFGLTGAFTFNGCDYTITTAGSVDIDCPGKAEIEMETVGNICVVHIPPQEDASTVTYTNNGDHIFAELNVELKATITKNSFLCPMVGGETTLVHQGDLTLEGDGGTNKIDIG